MMGKAKAPGEQGQAAQGWGLGRVGWQLWEQEGSARGPAGPALLPLFLSVHRLCPQVELWGLNKGFFLGGINHSSAAWEADTARASPEQIHGWCCPETTK